MKTRESYIRGTITLSDKTVIQLKDENLVKNTLYIENQCVNNSALEFGAVYSAECGFTFITDVDRYKLFDAEIAIEHVISGRVYNMGKFVVYDSNRVGSKVNIKALDHMTDFDIFVSDILVGTPYELIKFMADSAGIEMLQTKEQIDALVNANYTYSINPTDVKTYRDGLKYLCMIMCSFATITPTGKLKITQYELNPSQTILKNDRLKGCSFSDFETSFNGVRCRFLADENFYPYEKIDEARSGITLDLGDIPTVNLTPDDKNKILNNIYQYIINIVYTPCSLNIPAMSDLTLGRMIKCKAINNTLSDVNTLIMKYKWNYRQKEVLTSYGENPRLQNIPKSGSGTSSRTESAIASQKVVINTESNLKDIELQDVTELVSLKFTSTSDCKPLIYCSVQFELDLDGLVHFYLYDGGTVLKEYQQYCNKGKNYILLTDVETVKSNSRVQLSLKAKCEYVESVERKQTADIATLKNYCDALKESKETYKEVSIDETIPTLKCLKKDATIIVYTQGIGTKLEWNGVIEITDNFELVGADVGLASFESSVDYVETDAQKSVVNPYA